MKRKQQFIMEEPIPAHGLGGWYFRLYADPDIIVRIRNLTCVQSVSSYDHSPSWVFIDPRYDYEEAWLEINDWLELETATPDPELWGDALPDMPE